MDIIVHEKYVNLVKEFILQYIEDIKLNDIIKEKFIEFYKTVSDSNSKQIYDEITHIYHQEMKRQRQLTFDQMSDRAAGEMWIITKMFVLFMFLLFCANMFCKRYRLKYDIINIIMIGTTVLYFMIMFAEFSIYAHVDF